jgi:2'-5' RNA ligase
MTMKVIIALPVPVSFISGVERHLADKKPHSHYERNRIGHGCYKYNLVSALISVQEEYKKRFEWIDKAYWRIVISILDTIDAIGAGLIEMAVKQAAVGFRQIAAASNKLSIQPAENPAYGERHIVGLEIDKGKAEIRALAEKIDEALRDVSKGTGRRFCDRIKRPFTPYLAVIRQGRTTRALSTTFALETVFDPPVGCVLDRIILHISGKMTDGERYESQKTVRLTNPAR